MAGTFLDCEWKRYKAYDTLFFAKVKRLLQKTGTENSQGTAIVPPNGGTWDYWDYWDYCAFHQAMQNNGYRQRKTVCQGRKKKLAQCLGEKTGLASCQPQ